MVMVSTHVVLEPVLRGALCFTCVWARCGVYLFALDTGTNRLHAAPAAAVRSLSRLPPAGLWCSVRHGGRRVRESLQDLSSSHRGLPHSCLPPGIRSSDLWPWLSSLSKAPNPAVFGRGGKPGKGFRMLLAHRLRWCFPRTPCQQRCWRTCHGGTPRTVALALSLHHCGSDTGRWAAHTKLPTSMGKIRGCQCVYVCRLATQRAQEAHSCSRTKKKLVKGNAGYAAQH